MKILNHRQIQQKIRRLAIQIWERNYEQSEIILAGINNNGISFAELLLQELLRITDLTVTVTRIQLNPAAPLTMPVNLEYPAEQLNDKVIIIVDDVANTGRTIFYAMKPLFRVVPKKIEVAVLIDRKHKSFPVRVNYVGLTLATTLKENINVDLAETEMSVALN
ncbi:MAG: phosphoribosyltransferase family protein [Saprospiraceae bacterium]